MATDSCGWDGSTSRRPPPSHPSRPSTGALDHDRRPVFDRAYLEAYSADSNAQHVTLTGEVNGETKMRLLANAGALIYTCSHDYIEAGAASFGEALRAGTPVVAAAWQPGSCADAALCEQTRTVVALDGAADNEAAESLLVGAIETVAPLQAIAIQEIGLARFDPGRHFQTLAARPC